MPRASAKPPLNALMIRNMKPPAKGRDDYPDSATPGLCLRVTADGSKTWTLRMRDAAGDLRRFTLGVCDDKQGLAWARREVAAMRARVKGGFDPKVAKVEARAAKDAADKAAREQAERDRVTLGVLVGEWAKARVALKDRTPRYVKEAARALRFAFDGEWDAPAAALDWDTVARALDRGSRVMAARTKSYGRAVFGWALKGKRGSVTANPFEAHEVAAVVQRERVLDDAELAEVWQASRLDTGVYGSIVRLLILTGQREQEVACLAWPELAADDSTWTIPKERAKNKKKHIVPLSALAQAELPADRGMALVFPGEGERHPHFQAWSRAKRRLDAAIATARAKIAKEAGSEPRPMSAWRLHDLRRTCATGLQRLGVRLEVTEAVLNHVSGSRRGVVGIYQRYDWDAEKRQALDAWAQHVAGLVSPRQDGNNVVQLREAS